MLYSMMCSLKAKNFKLHFWLYSSGMVYSMPFLPSHKRVWVEDTLCTQGIFWYRLTQLLLLSGTKWCLFESFNFMEFMENKYWGKFILWGEIIHLSFWFRFKRDHWITWNFRDMQISSFIFYISIFVYLNIWSNFYHLLTSV